MALISFLISALIASRLSTKAEQRARDAIDRQKDLERLYSFSRAILLIEGGGLFPESSCAASRKSSSSKAPSCFDRRSSDFTAPARRRSGGVDEQLRECGTTGGSYVDLQRRTARSPRCVSAPSPIASLSVQGAPMGDAVLQGIANLVAIGLERARAQDSITRSKLSGKASSSARR